MKKKASKEENWPALLFQAIIDSCTRQFPEFSERARKRIRTYLKSCRRTKRSREQAGLDINNVSNIGVADPGITVGTKVMIQ